MNEAWRTAIIADDLTGACDTGVQFASPGSPSTVLLVGDAGGPAADALTSILASDGRVIVDTESRHLTAEQAYDRVRTIAEYLGDCPVDLVYKKIDSTLRGNVRSEIVALQDAFPDRIAVIAPAYPAADRTVVDGRCLVKGRPVDETEFGRDRRSPVTSARLADYVRAGAQVIATRADALAGALREAERSDVVIVDASTDGELDVIAALIAADPVRYVPVGSAGLAGALQR
ncbi:MAG: four-carbon acid sugar kinase family protein, partial [Spirochaetota bacterium]